jgi:hypothetical protein
MISAVAALKRDEANEPDVYREKTSGFPSAMF